MPWLNHTCRSSNRLWQDCFYMVCHSLTPHGLCQQLHSLDPGRLALRCREAPWDRAHYQHRVWRWTQCCRFDWWWPVSYARWFYVSRCRVLAYPPTNNTSRGCRRWPRGNEGQDLLVPVVLLALGRGQWWWCWLRGRWGLPGVKQSGKEALGEVFS